MRLLLALLLNAARGAWALLRWPLRRLRRPPEWVRIRLRGQLPYRQRPRAPLLQRLLRRGREPVGSDAPSLHALTTHLRQLARDPRVQGVVLIVQDLVLSAAQRAAVRAALGAFQEAGKRVVGFGVSLGTPELEILAVADRILVPAAGRVEFVGYAAELTALGDGLSRIGVRAEFLRRGDYKTAPELFTRRDISDIQRATAEALLDDRFALLVEVLATGRGLSEDVVRRCVDEGPYSARRALAAGLIDGLCSEALLPEWLAANPITGTRPASGGRPPRVETSARGPSDGQVGPERHEGGDAASHLEASGEGGFKASVEAAEDTPRKGEGQQPSHAAREEDGDRPRARVGSLQGWQRSRAWAPGRMISLRRQPGLALVPLRGAIMPGDGGLTPMGRAVGSDVLIRALRRLEKAPGVDAVLLLIESPGGSALASELILEAVQRLDRVRPVLAYVDGVCASGGYMAAMGAREFWAAPHAIVGSIGVFGGKFDLSGLMARLGIVREIVTRGEHAALHSSARGFTPGERAALDLEIEETYRAFLEIVAAGRRTTPEAIHAHGEGRIFSGLRAQAFGLVDRNGTFEDACRRALELAGHLTEDFRLLSVTAGPREVSIRTLLPSLSGTRIWALADPLPRWSDERGDAVELEQRAQWMGELLTSALPARDSLRERW